MTGPGRNGRGIRCGKGLEELQTSSASTYRGDRQVEKCAFSARDTVLDRRSRQQIVRETKRNGAHLIQSPDMIGRQRNIDGGELVVELSAAARSDDRSSAFGADPGDGDAACVRTRLFCDRLQHVDDGGLLRRVLGVKQPATATTRSFRVVLMNSPRRDSDSPN